MEIYLFCAVGKHGGPKVSELSASEKVSSAKDWRLLPASLGDDNEWFYDPTSMASIYICPKCFLKGEPRNN